MQGYDSWVGEGAKKELADILEYARLNRVKNFVFVSGAFRSPCLSGCFMTLHVLKAMYISRTR